MLALGGCTPPTVPEKIQQEYACKEQGGLYEYSNKFLSLKNPQVQCYSGAYKPWITVVATKDFVEDFKHRQNLKKELGK